MQQPPPHAPPGGAPPPAAMVSKVEMTISCEGLRDADVFSKSDPICVLYNLEGNKMREVSVYNLFCIYFLFLQKCINVQLF